MSSTYCRRLGFTLFSLDRLSELKDSGVRIACLGTLKVRRKLYKPDLLSVRVTLAEKYLQGEGIEIGALHSPLQLGPKASVRYVDRFPVAHLLEHYPELSGAKLTEADVIDNGESLNQFPENSVDFIVANHFLEHCQNFLGTLRTHLTKIRKGGVLFYAIPDKRYTFDYLRPLTSFEHLIEDDVRGPEFSRTKHFEDWVRYVTRVQDPLKAEQEKKNLMEMDYSIHFHVWTLNTLKKHIRLAQEYLDSQFNIEEVKENGIEVVLILRKV